MFKIKAVEKFETQILYSVTFLFRKLCSLYDNVEKYYKAEEATDDNMVHALCMLDT